MASGDVRQALASKSHLAAELKLEMPGAPRGWDTGAICDMAGWSGMALPKSPPLLHCGAQQGLNLLVAQRISKQYLAILKTCTSALDTYMPSTFAGIFGAPLLSLPTHRLRDQPAQQAWTS